MVFEDQETWAGFWLKHISNIFVYDPDVGHYVPLVEPPPEVNFDEEIVVVTFQGEQRTSGFKPIIECVQYIESSLIPGTIESVRVNIGDYKPGPTCIVQFVITNPYYMAAVDRSQSLLQPAVTLLHETRIIHCPSAP